MTPNAAFTKNLSPRCSNASFKIDLQIKTDVDAYFVPNPIIGCQPLIVNFDNRSDIAQKFYWDFGDGTVDSTTLNPTHTYTEPGIYEITLLVIDSNACNISDDFRRTVEVLGQSTADFKFVLDPCTLEAEFELIGEALDLEWKLSDGTVETQEKFKKTFEPGSINSVTLVVNKGTLCADSITKEVSTANAAQREVFIPNVFTPNGDPTNNTYCIDGFLDGCDAFNLWIYNRWGELVFKTDDMNECWDGTVSNSTKLHPPGTYFYILEVTEGKFGDDLTVPLHQYETSGTVTLIRD